MDTHIALPKRPRRTFLPEDFTISTWPALKPYFDQLLAWEIKSVTELKEWLKAKSELESMVSEDAGWRYIKMTCFTENETYRQQYQDFVQHIRPHIAPLLDALNKKIMNSPHTTDLEAETKYHIMLRGIRKDVELFREENIPLFTRIDMEVQKYNQRCGAMTVESKGKEITLQQAGVFLLNIDRSVREDMYKKIMQRRLRDKDSLDDLFSTLLQTRHEVAHNTGFKNFRDYMFMSYGRFDYTPQDCFSFHEAVQLEVLPLVHEIAYQRKMKLGVEKLRPWDRAVDIEGRSPLKAFSGGQDLIQKGITCFTKIDPFLGHCFSVMNEMKHLDLESRLGKAPGGYNYPLPEIGVPFIFMNATSTLHDMVTILHEGGHAVHNFLTMELELLDFKSPPMEMAELASMSMELISMDHWDVFFDREEDLKRAKRGHLEGILDTLPWVATIDQYQHWLYENHSHTKEERKENWNRIFDTFADSITDWSGLEEGKDYLWHKQLHLYEVPFYYIEYGIAQLGAIAIWRNYKKNPEKGIQDYMNALKLGYTCSLPDLYKAAHIQFNFSRSYIRELISFVKEEMEQV